MTKRDRLRGRLRNQPAQASMQDVTTLLERFGFRLVRTSGSHHIYEYDDGEQSRQMVIPLHGRKVKAVYVRKVIELIDELFPLEPDSDNESEDDADDQNP